MLVILTAVISFLSASLPNLLKFFELKAKLKHELQITTLKLEAAIRNVDANKDVQRTKEDIQDIMDARDADENSNLPDWLEIVRGLVRPIITMAMFMLFFWWKFVNINVLYQSGLNIDNMEVASKIIMDDTTISIFMVIIGFYFGGRIIPNKLK